MPDPGGTPAPSESGRGPTKRQIQAAATRERMVGAAREVFEERGYQAASVALITAAADTAHGTFYLYFKNKDEAFVEVIAAMGVEMRDLARARLRGDRRDSLEAVLRAFFEVFASHAPLWRALLEGMLQSPRIEQVWLATSASFTDRIADRLTREQAAGLMRPVDPLGAAQALASMAEWTAFRRFATREAVARGPASPEEIDAAIATVTDLWFQAVYGRTDPVDLP